MIKNIAESMETRESWVWTARQYYLCKMRLFRTFSYKNAERKTNRSHSNSRSQSLGFVYNVTDSSTNTLSQPKLLGIVVHPTVVIVAQDDWYCQLIYKHGVTANV